MAIPAMNLQPSRARLSFDGFELDEVDARLTCDGEFVRIPPRPFAVLCALARRPGHLLTKHDLLDAVWGHRFVSDSVLKSAISEVRAALQDDPRRPRYIETIVRRGYRFIVPPRGTSVLRRHADDDAGKPDLPTPAALTALCRGDTALADLILMTAATLERERLAPEYAPDGDGSPTTRRPDAAVAIRGNEHIHCLRFTETAPVALSPAGGAVHAQEQESPQDLPPSRSGRWPADLHRSWRAD